MRRWIALFISLILLFSACSSPPAPAVLPTKQQLVARAIDSTVILADADQTRILCAGQFIGPTQIITAEHCINDAVGCEETDPLTCQIGKRVFFVTRESYETDFHFSVGVVKAVDFPGDLALIVTHDLSPVWAQMRTKLPLKGEMVFSVGHPRSIPYTLGIGIVSDAGSATLISDSSLRIQVSIPIWFGSSGGGLYDENGLLIGVASQMVKYGTVGFFVPTSLVTRLLACRAPHGICPSPKPSGEASHRS